MYLPLNLYCTWQHKYLRSKFKCTKGNNIFLAGQLKFTALTYFVCVTRLSIMRKENDMKNYLGRTVRGLETAQTNIPFPTDCFYCLRFVTIIYDFRFYGWMCRFKQVHLLCYIKSKYSVWQNSLYFMFKRFFSSTQFFYLLFGDTYIKFS